MKALLRTTTLAAMAVAAIALFFLSPATMEKDTKAQPADELDYPVLLVHGLGEGPGDDAFGKLEEYLEKYYFDVEVMDFNAYSKKAEYVNHKNKDHLGIMATLLGIEIRKVLDEYDTDKVHIVAHSFGGLIVQAYLLNYGEEFNKQRGSYDDNVAKVCYIQTPFYGSTADPEVLEELVVDTDYGAYTNKLAMLGVLEPGNNWLFDMDEKLRASNMYRERSDGKYIDAVTFISRDDEIVEEEYGLLNAFMKKDDTVHFHHFVVFDGRFGNYSHSVHPSSAADKQSSLAYVEKLDDQNFLAMVSFLDNGRNWRKIGFRNIPEEGIVMVKYEKMPGFKDISIDDVTLLLKKRNKGEEPVSAPKRTELKASHYNQATQTFVFSGLLPGTYTLSIANSKNGELEEDINVDFNGLTSFAYDPKEHKLYAGGQKYMGPSHGIFYLERLDYTAAIDQEQSWHPLHDLDTSGFVVEFDVEDFGMDLYNKGIIFSLYNASGRQDDWRWNGGRLEFIFRGNRYLNGPGCVNIHFMVDKNKDGRYERTQGGLEAIEAKSIRLWDWRGKYHIKLMQLTTPTGGSRLDVWVDGEIINPWRPEAEVTKNAPYYNPDPIISFGGRYHNAKYNNPSGLIVTNFTVYNIDD